MAVSAAWRRAGGGASSVPAGPQLRLTHDDLGPAVGLAGVVDVACRVALHVDSQQQKQQVQYLRPISVRARHRSGFPSTKVDPPTRRPASSASSPITAVRHPSIYPRILHPPSHPVPAQAAHLARGVHHVLVIQAEQVHRASAGALVGSLPPVCARQGGGGAGKCTAGGTLAEQVAEWATAPGEARQGPAGRWDFSEHSNGERRKQQGGADDGGGGRHRGEDDMV